MKTVLPPSVWPQATPLAPRAPRSRSSGRRGRYLQRCPTRSSRRAAAARPSSLSIDVTLRDARGNPTNSVSSGAPATAVAQVLGRTAGSQQRQPVPGVVVTLGAQAGVISPLGGSAVTDGNGQATFTVSAGAQAGTDVLSATVQGPSGPVTDSLVYDIDTATFAATLELLDASGRPTSIIRDGAPVTLRVRVNSTPDGRPVEDAIVQAATTVASLRPANGRAITDRNGEALFELAAGDGAGGDVVDVTIEAESGTIVRSIGYQVLEPRFDISLRLLDADGNDTSLVTTARPAVLRVDIDSLDSPPQPVSGIVASAEAGFAIIRPESGTSLTDAGGVAEFTVQAGETEGADLIRVSVDTGTSVIERTIGVQVNASNLRLGSFAGGVFRDGRVGFTVEELPFGGSTRVNLAIIDEQGDLVTTEQEVRLTSDCSVEGAAGFREIGDDGTGQSSLVVAAVQGLVEAEYVASSCEGEDQVRATLVGGTLSATGTLQISSLNANFIGFFSADPSEGPEGGDRTIIALKSTGGAPAGRSETARITFEVLAQRPQLAPATRRRGPGLPAEPGPRTAAGGAGQFLADQFAGGHHPVRSLGAEHAAGDDQCHDQSGWSGHGRGGLGRGDRRRPLWWRPSSPTTAARRSIRRRIRSSSAPGCRTRTP